MIYKYIIDPNDEELWTEEILSKEFIGPEEFESIVKKAIDKCKEGGDKGDFVDVARMIVKMDKRFFYPEIAPMAIIDGWKDKFEGVFYNEDE